MTEPTSGSGHYLDASLLNFVDNFDDEVDTDVDWPYLEPENMRSSHEGKLRKRTYLNFARAERQVSRDRSSDEVRKELHEHIQTYLSKGGKIHVLPPQKSDYRCLEQATYSPRLRHSGFGYPNERLSKSEALGLRMNITGMNLLNVPGSNPEKLDANSIAAALAMGNLSRRAQNLAYYKYTGDSQTLKQLRLFFLQDVVDTAEQEKWDVRKKMILERMVSLAIDNVVNPNRYRGISNRQWARMMGLSANGDWAKRWSKRYTNLLNKLTTLCEKADAHLERQL